jgi:hypothetical protein
MGIFVFEIVLPMKRNLTEITQEAHIVASPWLVGPTTPAQQTTTAQQPSPFEPPNRASREEIEAIYPDIAPLAGEDR